VSVPDQRGFRPAFVRSFAIGFSGMKEMLRLHIWNVRAGQDLKARALRGGLWLGSGSTVEQLSRFARNLILVRLLAPQAFGTMAIVLSSVASVTSLSDVGLREAIIQNPRGTESAYLNAAWWLGIGRGVGVYAVVFALAPWLSRFYGDPNLVLLLRVAFLGVLFDAALSQKAVLSLKTMTFNKWAAVSHGGSVCGVCITLILAYFFRNTWTLAVGYCTESASRCVLSYVICPGCPRLPTQRNAARELLRFSKGLLGLSALNLILSRADIFVLAKVFSVAELGLYSMGISLVQAPTSFLLNLLGQTLLPVYSQVQTDKSRVNQILHTVISLVLLFGMPAITCLAFSGRAVLTVIYGHLYARVAAPLVVASGVAMLTVLNGQLTTVLYAAGRPNVHRISVIVMAGIMVLSIYPLATRFGPTGGQLAALLAVATGLVVQLVRLRRMLGTTVRSYAPVLLYSFYGSLAVVGTCLCARVCSISKQPLPAIAAGIVGCLLAVSLYSIKFLRGGRLTRRERPGAWSLAAASDERS
jgi:lipopolysaccharide exporter